MTGLDSEQLQSEDGESPVKVEVKQEQNEKVPDQDLPDDSGNDAVDENELEAKNEKSFIDFVREICKEMLDTQIPITLQPPDKITQVVDDILANYKDCTPDRARKRVQLFLKNCRKTQKRKMSGTDGKTTPKRKKPKIEKEPPSPWDVISLEVFLHYKCPICVYTCKEEMMFIDHAYEYHEESVVYLCKLTTMDQLDRNDFFDGEEHNDFVEHDDFRWDADSDSCLDNNQPVVECKVEVKEVNDAEDKNFLDGKSSEPLDEDLVGFDKEYTPEDSDEDWKESKPKTKKGNKDNVTVSSKCVDFVREICKERLDTTIPITLQSPATIQQMVDDIVARFPDCSPELARRKVRIFLKNRRKKVKQAKLKHGTLSEDKTKCEVKNGDDILPGETSELKSEDNGAPWLPKNFACDQCDMKFYGQGKLTQHQKRVHSGEKNWQCSECPSAFGEKYKLTRHMDNVHGGRPAQLHFCDKCPKTFTKKSYLTRHTMITHDKVGRFQCDQCEKYFYGKYELKVHQDLHAKVRNFQCQLCPMAFATNRYLHRHEAQVHQIGIEKYLKFPCPQCDKKLPNNFEVKRHMAQSHGGERPYPCPKCDKGYLCPSDLERHILTIHEGIKPEVCDICHKTFSLRGNLTAHKKKVHKVLEVPDNRYLTP